MSKWLNAGTLLGGASGAVAATVAVWQAFQPGPIQDANEVVAALRGIQTAIEAGHVDLSQPEVQSDIAEAAQPVASLLTRNLNALGSGELASLGGIADAAPGERVEFRTPDGRFVGITFQSWNQTPPNAVLVFEGERVITQAGWEQSIDATECTLIFVGPTRDEQVLARFQLRCD